MPTTQHEDDSTSGDLTPGDNFGPFVIQDRVAAGGMSTIYRADHKTLGRAVALKILAPRLSEDPEFRRQFAEEARIASSIDHPNVIPVYSSGQYDGHLYIAMRLVENSLDLRHLIAEHGQLHPTTVIGIATQLAAALDALHRQGLAHRDVKPDNVLIDRSGRSTHVYLSDFGLTRDNRAPQSIARSTQGTVNYASPEQLRSDPVDARSDVYSLSCVLYECLAGVPPFQRDDDAATLYAQLNDPPPRLTTSRGDLPIPFDSILARGMAKNPADRYGTCRELVSALSTAFAPDRQDLSETSVTGWTFDDGLDEIAQTTIVGARPRHRWRIPMGIAVVVAGILTVLVMSRSRDGEPPPDTVGPQAATFATGGTIKVAFDETADQWQPLAQPWGPAARQQAATVFDPLVVLGPSGPEPYLASRLETSDDRSTWTIGLRPDVSFHDGTPANAESVRAQIEAARSAPLFAEQLAPVVNVSVPGPLEVKVEMDGPWPSFPYTLATQLGYLAAPATFTGTPPERPIGTGPFRLASNEAGADRVERNPDYWLPDRPFLDSIEFVENNAFSDRLRGAREGQSAVIEVTGEQVDDPQLRGSYVPFQIGTNVSAIAFNMRRSPLDNPKLREALTLARPEDSTGDSATRFSSPFVTPPWDIPSTSYAEPNPTKATELVAQLPTEARSRILEVLVTPGKRAIGNALIERWRASGIRANAIDTPNSTLWAKIESGNFDAAVLDIESPFDPDVNYAMFHKSSRQPGRGPNLFGLSDERVDVALDRGRREINPENRKTAYTESVNELNAELPAAWISVQTRVLMLFDQVVATDLELGPSQTLTRPLFTSLAVKA